MSWARWCWRAISVHRGRFAFSVVSVVLGVAAFVGVSIGVGTLSDALQLGTTARAGSPSANVVVIRPAGVWTATAPRSAVAPLRHIEGVRAVQATVWTRVRG